MVPEGLALDGAGLPARYCFDDVVVDTGAHTLTRGGQPCAVEPKAFAVLLLLLRHAGEMVGKEDLLDAVWGHRHVTPGVLTRSIAQLRAALGDDAHSPRFIHTHHALGYRFIGELLEPAGGAVGEAATEPPPDDADAGVGAPPHAAPPPRPDALPRPAPTPGDAPAGAAPRSRRRVLAWIGTVGALVLAAVLLTHGLSDPRPPVGEASVAVMPFRSLSTDRRDRYFAEGLAVEMHGALAGVPGLKVAALVPGPADGDGAEPLDPHEMGERLGVANVLDASVRRDGQRIRISARLTDTRSGFILWSQTYDRQGADIFSTQAEIANKVVQALMGVLPPDAPALARRLHPTSQLSAYEPYLKGLQLLQGTASIEQLGEAVAHFEQALRQDPGFARAQAGICRARIRAFELGRDAGVYARAQAACLQAARLDPALGEVSLAMGDLHRARNELDAARESYTQALQDVSLRPAAYIGLGRIEGEQGHDALALDYFDRARQLRPGDAVVYREIGYQHYLDDRMAEAIESYRVATTLEPDDAGLWSSLGGLYLADGRRGEAESAFERSLAIKPVFGALSNLGTLRYEQGDYPRAAELYARAAAMNPGDYRPVGNTADALAASPGSAGTARTTYARAAEMAERYVSIKSGDAEAMAWLAWYRANLDEPAAARAWLEKARKAGTSQAEVAFLSAQVHARLGETDLALGALADARALDVAETRIQASPVLKRLSGGAEVASQGGS